MMLFCKTQNVQTAHYNLSTILQAARRFSFHLFAKNISGNFCRAEFVKLVPILALNYNQGFSMFLV